MGMLHREKHDDDVVGDAETALPYERYEPEAERVVRPAPVLEHHDRVERVDHSEVARAREREWTVAPGQVVSLVAGVAFAVVGLIALIRAGIDGALEEPVVQVLGWDHTAWLGLAEVGFGLLLVLAGAGARGRPLSIVLGVLAVIAGVIILAEFESLPSDLGVEREFGWPLAITGGVVALAAMLMPVWRSHTVNRGEIDLRDRDRDNADT